MVHRVVNNILQLLLSLLLLIQDAPSYVLKDAKGVRLIVDMHSLGLDVNQKLLVDLIIVLEA